MADPETPGGSYPPSTPSGPPLLPYAEPAPPGPPGVWPWFIVYCVVMALFFTGGCAVGSIFLVVDPNDLDMDPIEAKIVGVFYIAISMTLFVPYVAAPFLPRRKWVWVYDLVLICMGMTSCCTLPACIPLLIFWIKPDVRSWFGWT